ncbi:MAG: hypothetical protein ABIH70_09665 [Chloroflexota bacterium]
MQKYYGGEPVDRGTYLGLKTAEFVQAHVNGTILPGGREVKFLRVPAALLFLGGPLIALAYIIFLPATGIGGLFVLAAVKVKNLVGVGKRAVQHTQE